jgi:uncharacterized protein
MIINLREAKSKLSQLVQRVAEGEEIVITVRGRPMARLTSVVPKETRASSREEWVAELRAAAESARKDPQKSTSQEFWDELRQERLWFMANAIYWDTSALLKLYASELDSGDYLRLLMHQPEDVAISFLHQVELYYAVCGKEARGEIGDGAAGRLFQLFEQHVSEGRYYSIPWGEDVVHEARQLLDASLHAEPPSLLRSLDGLHLGALRAAKLQAIVTADRRMRHAARLAAIDVIDP